MGTANGSEDPLQIDFNDSSQTRDGIDLAAQQILLASSRHEIATLRGFLRDYTSGTSSAAGEHETPLFSPLLLLTSSSEEVVAAKTPSVL